MDEKLYRMDGNSVSPVSYSFFDTEDKLQALIAENPDLLLHELYSAEDISAVFSSSIWVSHFFVT